MFGIPTPNSFLIEGGKRLSGEIEIQGAKNSALPAIAAALLVEKGETILHNVPHIQDVLVAIEIAQCLGAKVDYDPVTHVATINAENLNSPAIPCELSEKMRAGLLFIAPLVVRLKEAQLLAVGGCKIGERKIDFHHRGFARLGAEVKGDEHANLLIRADSLRGTYLYLDVPSHTGTENLMMAACRAEGETIIDNAASDPEVVDFAGLLQGMGARISGIGSRTIFIQGVRELKATEHWLIPDRHDFSALAMAVAATGGQVAFRNVVPSNQRLLDAKLRQMGVIVEHEREESVVSAPEPLCPINIVTSPYPGFPTDAQPLITALATIAVGKSYIREAVFDERFSYVEDLNRMGAEIIISQNSVIIVEGVRRLTGQRVRAHDLRAGFACIIAGLAAEGITVIDNPYQIQRGHEDIVTRLNRLGARMREI